MALEAHFDSKTYESLQHHHERLSSPQDLLWRILVGALIEIHLHLTKPHEILNFGCEAGKTGHRPLIIRWILTPHLHVGAPLVLFPPGYAALSPIRHGHLSAGPWNHDTQGSCRTQVARLIQIDLAALEVENHLRLGLLDHLPIWHPARHCSCRKSCRWRFLQNLSNS